MRRKSVLILLFYTALLCSCATKQNTTLDIAGQWTFKLDSLNKGIDEKWYLLKLTDTVNLPGSLTSNNIGNKITKNTPWLGSINDLSWFTLPKYAKYRTDENCKVPFWLTPATYYSGAVWYQKEIELPASWEGKQVQLNLERCHGETRLWIDNNEVGMQNSLSTAHCFDLTKFMTAGKHTLTLRVDNSYKIDVGINAHSVSDHTQGNWNGVIGKMEIVCSPQVYIKTVKTFPSLEKKMVQVKVIIANNLDKPFDATIELKALSDNTSKKHNGTVFRKEVELKTGDNELSFDYPMGDDFLTWSEFSPAYYNLTASVTGADVADEKLLSFGMREFKVKGTQFEINGRPTFLRGTLECCIFPLTGYPPTDEAAYSRIFKIAQSFGLNHIRFHSWCPPEAAFVAADKAGIYLQVECAGWAAQGSSLGDGKNIDTYIYDESERIVNEYGNHPSFCLMTYGNEPDGQNSGAFLGKFVNYWKAKDNRRLYTSAGGWPIIPESDYISNQEARIQSWVGGQQYILNSRPPQTIFDYEAIISKYTVPYISHEIGQWCVFPNLNEISKYTGVMKARNFELFKEDLADNLMADQANSFLMASGKLQALCYKSEIEAALRTKGMAGFQLLDLHDFPGQGTALVGVLDAFWDDKGYITAKEYSRFCNQTVLLASMEKMVYTNQDTFHAQVEVSHFGEKPLNKALIHWVIKDSTQIVIAEGKFAPTDLAIGNGQVIGEVKIPLLDFRTPQKYSFSIKIESLDVQNSWEFFVYPSKQEIIAQNNVYVTKTLDSRAMQILKAGGNVFLNFTGAFSKDKEVFTGFTPTFWNTLWFNKQPSHTLGILVNPQNPAFASFPTDYYTNWQWWEIVMYSKAMILSDMPAELRPTVQVIDTWHKNRRLGIVFEAKVEKGKLLICTTDFTTDIEKRPAAKQFQNSLLKYAGSQNFAPQVEVKIDDVKALFGK